MRATRTVSPEAAVKSVNAYFKKLLSQGQDIEEAQVMALEAKVGTAKCDPKVQEALNENLVKLADKLRYREGSGFLNDPRNAAFKPGQFDRYKSIFETGCS
jgi:hypothetical protein